MAINVSSIRKYLSCHNYKLIFHTNTMNITLINFIVSCPKCTMFLKSIHASNQAKSAKMFCELLESIVKNVTDNATNLLLKKISWRGTSPFLWFHVQLHCLDFDVGEHWKSWLEKMYCWSRFFQLPELTKIFYFCDVSRIACENVWKTTCAHFKEEET